MGLDSRLVPHVWLEASDATMVEIIQKDLYSMAYVSVDDTICEIITLGRGTLLAKIDIKSAFWLIPVYQLTTIF